jgi:hypothetical protein
VGLDLMTEPATVPCRWPVDGSSPSGSPGAPTIWPECGQPTPPDVQVSNPGAITLHTLPVCGRHLGIALAASWHQLGVGHIGPIRMGDPRTATVVGTVQHSLSDGVSCNCCEGPHRYASRIEGVEGSGAGWVRQQIRSLPQGARVRVAIEQLSADPRRLFLWSHANQLYSSCPVCHTKVAGWVTTAHSQPEDGTLATAGYIHSVVEPCGCHVTGVDLSVVHPLRAVLRQVLAAAGVGPTSDLVADQLLVRLYEAGVL